MADGLCQCGCGKKTGVARQRDPRRGVLKGQPMRYLHGHGGHCRKPLSDRFWSMIDKGPDCWEWSGRLRKDGYAQIARPGMGSGMELVHRVSWEIHNGQIPDGMSVLHRCDNRKCVRPSHLFIGTQKDNMADCAKKERFSHSKLNSKLVKEIRLLSKTGLRNTELQSKYGVSYSSIWQILTGKTWAHA